MSGFYIVVLKKYLDLLKIAWNDMLLIITFANFSICNLHLCSELTKVCYKYEHTAGSVKYTMTSITKYEMF